MWWVEDLIYAVDQFEWDAIHLIAVAAVACVLTLFAHDLWWELRAQVRRWRARRRPIRHVEERYVEASGYSDPAFRPALGGRSAARPRVARGPARRVDFRTTGVVHPRPVDAPVRLLAAVRPEAARRAADLAAVSGRLPRHPQGAA